MLMPMPVTRVDEVEAAVVADQAVEGHLLPPIKDLQELLGDDVTHPPPRTGVGSIAASLATANGAHMSYGHEIHLQSNPGRGQSQE
ncbi:hypothetical protein A4X13_0g8069 [Tilletia indica]|uniref:Uncharacterized protein n=1 Tax=Tilletia indica TaxID=43049 RepID=A0A8T8SGB8_9BASI|nr:hypothetical protein A4X13_0g8069 [Tilletia indica]